MNTKYNIGDKVLIPFKIQSIWINVNGDICYKLANESLIRDRTLEVDEEDIYKKEELE